MAKASVSKLDELHEAIATKLMENLDDPKILASAIKFLKDNNITADLQESRPANDLFTKISELKVRPEDSNRDRIDVILEQYA